MRLYIKDIKSVKTVTTSDHFLISFSCSFTYQNEATKVHRTGRKIYDIDIQMFKEDILLSDHNVAEKYQDSTVTQLLNFPIKSSDGSLMFMLQKLNLWLILIKVNWSIPSAKL